MPPAPFRGGGMRRAALGRMSGLGKPARTLRRGLRSAATRHPFCARERGLACLSRPIFCAFAPPPRGEADHWRRAPRTASRRRSSLPEKAAIWPRRASCAAENVHTVHECNNHEGAGDTRPHDCRFDHRRDRDHRPLPDRPYPGMDKTQRDAAALKRRLNMRRRNAPL